MTLFFELVKAENGLKLQLTQGNRDSTPLKMTYEAAKKRVEPYTKIVGELPKMRRETLELAKNAVAENRQVYVLVNNGSEGNAP